MATPTNDDGLTFAEWLALADERCDDRAGIGLRDLPDGAERDAWRDGMPPEDYADELLDEEGCP